jgi:hypothetical protein
MVGVVANMLTVPHPTWVWIAGIVELALFAYGGGQLARVSDAAA